jgi:hypothetical protein
MRARGVACVIAAPRPVESTRRPWGERAALCPFPCEIVGGKGWVGVRAGIVCSRRRVPFFVSLRFSVRRCVSRLGGWDCGS